MASLYGRIPDMDGKDDVVATLIGRRAMDSKHPTFANGKICYLEIPCTDINASAAFYRAVFGWKIRQRGDGSVAFDDGVNEVSGTWVPGRTPSTQPGLLLYVMVDSVAATIEAVLANGGKLVQPIGGDAPEITARFSDPAGNVLGLFQERAAE
jgi:predicted enzyme related to lactoylglutathione lyase